MSSKKRLPWFHCYPGKWLGALAAMRQDEGYLYLIVCFRIYEIGGPCRDTIDALALRTHMNRKRVSGLLDRLFAAGKLERTDGGIMNPFAAELLGARETTLHRLRENGAAGASARWQKNEHNQRIEDGKSHSDLWQTHADLDLDIDSEKKISVCGPPARWPRDAFNKFYSAYPRKKERVKAEKAFAKIAAKPPLPWDAFMAAVKRYADYAITRADPKFVKYPATWLNAGCWADEDDQPPKGPPDGQGRPRHVPDDSRSLVKAADRLIEKAERGEFTIGPRPGRPGLAAADGEDDVRLLPPGGRG